MFRILEPRGRRHLLKFLKPWWNLRHQLLFPEWLIVYWRQEEYTGGLWEERRPGEGTGGGAEADSAGEDGGEGRRAGSNQRSRKMRGLWASLKEKTLSASPSQ